MKINRLEKQFGINVAKRRHRLGLTQKQVANNLGVSRETIASIENGYHHPMLIHAFKLRKLLGVKL